MGSRLWYLASKTSKTSTLIEDNSFASKWCERDDVGGRENGLSNKVLEAFVLCIYIHIYDN